MTMTRLWRSSHADTRSSSACDGPGAGAAWASGRDRPGSPSPGHEEHGSRALRRRAPRAHLVAGAMAPGVTSPGGRHGHGPSAEARNALPAVTDCVSFIRCLRGCRVLVVVPAAQQAPWPPWCGRAGDDQQRRGGVERQRAELRRILGRGQAAPHAPRLSCWPTSRRGRDSVGGMTLMILAAPVTATVIATAREDPCGGGGGRPVCATPLPAGAGTAAGRHRPWARVELTDGRRREHAQGAPRLPRGDRDGSVPVAAGESLAHGA